MSEDEYKYDDEDYEYPEDPGDAGGEDPDILEEVPVLKQHVRVIISLIIFRNLWFSSILHK